MLRGYLQSLIAYIRMAGNDGITIHKASTQMASVQGFTADLKAARATLQPMVELFPEIRVDRRRGHQILNLSDDVPKTRAGTLDEIAQ